MARDDRSHLPGRLFVVSGPSGVGKTTVVRRLLERPGLQARQSVSATTREPRAGERDGIDYYFLTREQFESARDRGEFLEWAEVHGHLYGTPADPVRNLMAQGVCVILVIDVQGGLQVRARVPEAVLVWLRPPGLETLEARLRARDTDDDDAIRRRLDDARREMAIADEHYPRELHVTNDDFREDQAAADLAALMHRFGCGG